MQVIGDYLKHLMEDSHFTAEVTIATGSSHRVKMAVSSRKQIYSVNRMLRLWNSMQR